MKMVQSRKAVKCCLKNEQIFEAAVVVPEFLCRKLNNAIVLSICKYRSNLMAMFREIVRRRDENLKVAMIHYGFKPVYNLMHIQNDNQSSHRVQCMTAYNTE